MSASFGGEMEFKIGQKVSYPNHGICAIESIDSKTISGNPIDVYTLRLIAFNSLILVPKENAASIGIRPVISDGQCAKVLESLANDFEEIEPDWKVRIRDFISKVQTGDIFEVADVLKKLTFLTQLKQLSFREQRLFEKTKFLVVSELATACGKAEEEIEAKVDKCINEACEKHLLSKIPIVSSAAN